MSEQIIELVGLTKKYGSFTAVDQLDLGIGKGEIFGLLGPNGAGKSTTLLMMLGLTEPSSGKVSVCGINPVRNPIEVKRRVGYLPEDLGFYDDRTGLENLLYTASLNRIPVAEAKTKALHLLERVGLGDALNKKTGKYSRGMRQRLGLADVLLKNPQVIILDEPTSGIDPQGVKSFLELVESLRNEQNLTILFSSHNLHQVEQVCDRVGIFVEGKLKACGDIEALARQQLSANRFLIELSLKNHSQASYTFMETDLLKLVDGVSSIRRDSDSYLIESTRDITSELARAVVKEGFDLTSLSKKEFGLEAVYNSFFEGGVHHG